MKKVGLERLIGIKAREGRVCDMEREGKWKRECCS